jgi:tetratricopeptide (TPR) repeat protein
MIGLVIIILLSLMVWLAFHRLHLASQQDVTLPKNSQRMNKLWELVKEALKNERYESAERNLLNILKIDHKNTAAYNRLGIIYAKQQNFDEAIECFDIASSITPTASTLYNLGLVQYEKGYYQKASTTFERVVDLEPNTKRYIAYAKALEKSNASKKVIDVLEKAAALDRKNPIVFELLAHGYQNNKQDELATKALKKAERLRTKTAKNSK